MTDAEIEALRLPNWCRESIHGDLDAKNEVVEGSNRGWEMFGHDSLTMDMNLEQTLGDKVTGKVWVLLQSKGSKDWLPTLV